MDELDQILAQVPPNKQAAVRAWLAEEQGAGTPMPAILGELRTKYAPRPQMAPADATRTAPMPPGSGLPLLGMGAAGAILGGYGAVKGVQAGAKAAVRNAAQGNLTRAVAETPGGLEALLASVQGYQQTGRGDRLTLSDLSPRLTAEADFVATKHPATAAAAQELNTARNRQRPTRLVADVERIAPGGYADASGLQQQIAAERSAWAAGPEGYGGLRAANPQLDRQGQLAVRQFFGQPRVSQLWNEAAAVGAIGPLPRAEHTSFEVLQGFKERLDGLTQAAFARGDGNLGSRLAAARDELVSVLERHVPGYAPVSAKYKRYMDQERTLEAAQEWWRDPNLQLPELERRLAAIPEQDRWLVQRGMLGSYLADVENHAMNGGSFERLLTELPVQQKKLEVAFGGARRAQEALRTFEQERALARLGSVGAGSQTAPRQAREAMSSGEVLGEAAHVLLHPTTGIPTVTRRGVARWIPGAVAGEMAPYMAPRTAPEMEALLRLLARAPK